MSKIKHFRTYIAGSPNHIRMPQDQRDFLKLVEWLKVNTDFVPWSSGHRTWWQPQGNERPRDFVQEQEVVDLADFMIALYHTNEAATRRENDVIRRLTEQRPMLAAYCELSPPSDYLKSMYLRYTSIPMVPYSRFTDLIPVAEQRLIQMAD